MADESAEEPKDIAEQTARDYLPSAKAMIQGHLTLVISGALTTLLLLRVALVSRFDATSALAIVSAGGTAEVLIGLALSLLPFAYTVGILMFAVFLGRHVGARIQAARWAAVAGLGLVALVLLLLTSLLVP